MFGSCYARVVHTMHATGLGFDLGLVVMCQPVPDVMTVFFLSHAVRNLARGRN